MSDGERVEHLSPKAVEVLVCLARNSGDIVSYEELIDCAWGESAGTREALGQVITQIRHALDDHVDNPTYIQTLPRRGYRLVVDPVLDSDHAEPEESYPGASDPGIFENLKRRGVLETGAAYLVLGWLIIQVADVVFDRLNFPDWVATFVTVLVIAGFPACLYSPTTNSSACPIRQRRHRPSCQRRSSPSRTTPSLFCPSSTTTAAMRPGSSPMALSMTL
ncbi:MAG: winged helix-turn-helix domain-containing protein [Woeseiaceae bacterium]